MSKLAASRTGTINSWSIPIGQSWKSRLPLEKANPNSLHNRFSQDMDLIDMSLPIEVFNVIACKCRMNGHLLNTSDKRFRGDVRVL